MNKYWRKFVIFRHHFAITFMFKYLTLVLDDVQTNLAWLRSGFGTVDIAYVTSYQLSAAHIKHLI